jgi:hypothetical protein
MPQPLTPRRNRADRLAACENNPVKLLHLRECCIKRRKIFRRFKRHKRKHNRNCPDSQKFAREHFALLRSPSDDNPLASQR